MAQTRSFFATTAKAMEPLLLQEVQNAGAAKVAEQRAGVSFEGGLEVAYRVCLNSRVANRVLIPLRSFHARNPLELYRGVQKIQWHEHLDPESTIAIDFSTTKSQLSHSQFGAQKVKDAIVDQLREKTGKRPSVDLKNPDLRINVYLHQNLATLSLDLSGNSLHRRGYREEGSFAPLKENLAAAMLLLAEWPEIARQGGALLDPMCGSGTLALEGASMALHRAPGLDRTRWGFQGWKQHRQDLWEGVLEEARSQALNPESTRLLIQGFDQSAQAVRVALNNRERAGLRNAVHFEKKDLSDFSPPAQAKPGIVIMNPPYGERLGEVEELKPLYREIGDVLKQRFKGWRAFVLTSNPELAKWIGLKTSRRFILFNGALECRLLRFDLY